MPEQLQNILNRIRDWWNRFTTRQKTLIVVVASAVVLTAVLLVAVLTRPRYILLMNAENTAQASEVKTLLDGNSIDYQISSDGLQFKVNEKQESDANLLLGANKIQAADYSIDNVTNGSFSTTESDKQKKYVDYLQKQLAGDFISNFDAIDNAIVELHIPENDGTLISKEQPASASILLKINDPEKFTTDNAAFLANAVATALGNENTDNIVIMSTDGDMLFSGGNNSADVIVSNQLGVKNKAEATMRVGVQNVLLGTKMFDSVEVTPHLAVVFDNVENVKHTYTPADGQTQGVLSHENTYSSETTNGVGGVPGTDSNDQTTYVLQDSENSTSSVEEESKDYLPNEEITTTSKQFDIDYAASTISVAAINYVVENEDDYVAADHNDMSWSEYKAANQRPVLLTDEELETRMIQMVANATGIATENVSFQPYDQMVFFDKTGSRISLTDILQIVLILVILALLGFVVFRSLRQNRQEEEEEEVQPEELSVESLLESQPTQDELENIEVDEGSETKRLIEKFVDENPEAAANLLRNWLNEDYT